MSLLKEHALQVIRTLHQSGFHAFLVGGCVRDMLLGREPADYDVATDATPTDVMRIFPKTYAVGAQFGVVLVAVNENETVEVATFRSDMGYSDGRHSDEVRFAKTPQEDVQRRDFTINGLLLDPLTDEVLDYVGGRKDLEAGIIRTIGDPEKRFAEDKLRMLRAVRFAARFGYILERGTMEAIQKLSPQISQVSAERVRDELTKMLTEGRARLAFFMLYASRLLREVLPEIAAMKGVEQPPEFHPEGDVFIHTLLLLDNLPQPCTPTLAWGALLHDVGKPPTFRRAPDRIRFDDHVDVGVKIAEGICQRLHFSHEDNAQIIALVDNHMRFAQADRMNESTLKKFMRMPRFDEHMELHRLDCTASHGKLESYNFVKDKLASMPPEVMRPAPLVTGGDLIGAGYEPGPRFREILEAVEDGQLENRLKNHEEAMEFIRSEFPLNTNN
jgi:poly(A) polymerase